MVCAWVLMSTALQRSNQENRYQLSPSLVQCALWMLPRAQGGSKPPLSAISDLVGGHVRQPLALLKEGRCSKSGQCELPEHGSNSFTITSV